MQLTAELITQPHAILRSKISIFIQNRSLIPSNHINARSD